MNVNEFENHLFDNMIPKKFKWGRQIGKGTFSKVFQCTYDNQATKFYAIKRIQLSHGDPDNPSGNMEEIDKEIACLNKLRTTKIKPISIPEYYGYFIKKDEGFNETTYCFVFEFLSKNLREVLNEKIRDNKHFELIEIKEIFNTLLHGFAFLQNIDLSHRDIKPENLAFDSNLVLKIIDFGLAKDLSELIRHISDTLSIEPTQFEMTIGGTIKYMAPEIIESINSSVVKRKMNAFKADVFSFGLIILEMMTLKKIDHQQNIKELEKQISENMQIISNYHKTLKGDDKKLVEKLYCLMQDCLEIKHKRRPDFLALFKKNLPFEEDKEKASMHIFIENLNQDEIKKTHEFCENLRKSKQEDLHKIEEKYMLLLQKKDQEINEINKKLETFEKKMKNPMNFNNFDKLSKNDLFYMAQTSEIIENFEEMKEFMKKLLLLEEPLSKKERMLLSISYKNAVNMKRLSLKKLTELEKTEKNAQNLNLLKNYKTKLYTDLTSISQEILKLLDDKIFKIINNDEDKVFFLKMKGDHSRWISEFSSVELNKTLINEANNAYQEAMTISNNVLSPTNITRLGLELNISVFYSESIKDQNKAINIARKTLENAANDNDIKEEEREKNMIIQCIKDNLELWQS